MKQVYGRTQQLHYTSNEWITLNPTLKVAEIGIESDTGKFKIGNGSDTWTVLPYANTGSGVTSHASTHASNGSDPITIAQSQVTNLLTDLGNKAEIFWCYYGTTTHAEILSAVNSGKLCYLLDTEGTTNRIYKCNRADASGAYFYSQDFGTSRRVGVTSANVWSRGSVVIPSQGSIASGNTGYVTGGDVYTAIGNVESLLSAI